jgi:uncharacterized protein (DUF488 family)
VTRKNHDRHAVRTIGHGTLAAEEFAALLRDAGVASIVDIRRFPGSRRHPQFGRDAMATWLPEQGIGYRWLASLGGRRTPRADSPNVALENAQFRAYADHMATEEFGAGIAELCAMPGDGSVAVMCAESVWWRCHRRLVSDHLVLVEEVRVEHLFHDGRVAAHVPMAEARRVGDQLVYDQVDPKAPGSP